MTVRAGFLFNHDQAHQVAHSLPVALALARARADVEVVLASTHPRLTAEVRRICTVAGVSPTVIELKLRSGWAQGLDAALGAVAPVRKIMIYGEHLDFFRSLDLLVVAEKTSLALKTRYGLALPIVHTRHGAGDRAVGFDPASALFDRVLVSGAKVRDRLVAEAGLDPARVSVVGYPKFDVAGRGPPPRLFGDGRPVVLYNPHASPRLSSWFRMGRRVLDVFARSGRFNLVFAPHVMLFERPVALPGRPARRHRKAPNIRTDLGGPACLDMTYTEAADIYLGDVSSQVYEFLRRPRPTVFLDAHRTAWRDDPNHAHWRTGPVVDDPAALEEAIDEAVGRHADRYGPIQRELFAYSFDLTDRPSSERAAEVLAGMLAVHARG